MIRSGKGKAAGPRKSEEVHIWTADLALWTGRDGSDIGRLSPDERRRAARFLSSRDRARFVARRGLLRRILGEYLSLPPDEIPFRYDRYGRPGLGQGNLRFNASSSGDKAVVAVAFGRRIGVDIEQVAAFPEMSSVAKHVFSSPEFEAYSSSGKAGREMIFFRFWTRKEALVKAIGGGLSLDLAALDVSAREGDSVREVVTGSVGRKKGVWTVRDLASPPGFSAAFALEGPSLPAPEIREFEVGPSIFA